MIQAAGAPVHDRGATQTHPDNSIPEGVHDLIDFVRDCAFANGYRQGVQDASRAVDAAIAEAVAGQPASAKAVIENLLRHWNRGTT